MNYFIKIKALKKIFALKLLVILGLFACTHSTKNKVAKHITKLSTGKQITKTKEEYLENLNTEFDVEPVVNPITIQDCNVYSEEDTLSTIKSIMPAFTSFERLKYDRLDSEKQLPNNDADSSTYTQYSSITWYKIRTSNGEEGYLKDMNKIARFTFDDTLHKVKYVISNPIKNGNYQFKISKYNWITHGIISSVECNYMYEAIQTARLVNITLKNTYAALHLSQHADFCGGGMSNILVIDTPSGLVLLPEAHTGFAEDGSSSSIEIYYPTKDIQNGSTYFYAYDELFSGRIKNNLIDYPTDSQLPVNELIIQKFEEQEVLVDKDDEPVVMKNGEEKVLHHSITTTYYRWDGNKVLKVKEKKQKLI